MCMLTCAFRPQEILLCGVSFKNDLSDRRVVLYLNDCQCGRKYCAENAAYAVKNQLKKVSLKEAAMELLIEYVYYVVLPDYFIFCYIILILYLNIFIML